MAYCRNCRTEYVAGITHCSDCGHQLVDERPRKDTPRDVHWVELCTAGSLAEGELLRERLGQRGIPVLLKKDVMAFGIGRQGTLLFVPQEHRAQADAVWRETLGEE
jgi:hypothetical protein